LGLAAGDWWDVRTPLHNEALASNYAESFRYRLALRGDLSTHHAIAVRDFAERMERSYGGSRVIGGVSGYIAILYGNYRELWDDLWDPAEDSADDAEANIQGLIDYLYGTRTRCEISP